MSHAKHYHIVQNTPGYIPENDIYCVSGRRAAIAAVSEEIERYTYVDIAYEGAEYATHYPRCRINCKRPHPTYRVFRSADRLSASIEDRSKTYDLGYVIYAESVVADTENCQSAEGY